MVDRARRAGWIGLAALIGTSLGACFSPTVQEGLACSESGSCPIGQVCLDQTTCVLAGSNGQPISDADASTSIVNPDASEEVIVPDADTSCQAGTVLCADECKDVCITTLTAAGETTYQPEQGCSLLRIDAWGAGGGHGSDNARGGAGGYAVLERIVTSAEMYTVMVGAGGTSANNQTPGVGGIPGGGNGGVADNNDAGGAGGGYSGVFLGVAEVANAVIIAGAGGGSGGGNGNGTNTNAGAGGGVTGQKGSDETSKSGGTQSSGFEELAGGPGGRDSDGGGGGGAGWWGAPGGSGVGGDDAQGGSGGSGFVESGIDADLISGNRGVPGNAAALADGETTALPTFAGKVILTCSAPIL